MGKQFYLAIKWEKTFAQLKFSGIYYSLHPKLYDVLGISQILRNAINIVWKRDIMSYFTKLSFINNMGKINERIERRDNNK